MVPGIMRAGATGVLRLGRRERRQQRETACHLCGDGGHARGSFSTLFHAGNYRRGVWYARTPYVRDLLDFRNRIDGIHPLTYRDHPTGLPRLNFGFCVSTIYGRYLRLTWLGSPMTCIAPGRGNFYSMKFLRKSIKQSPSPSWGRYFLYPVMEVVLTILGMLTALHLNDNKEARGKEAIREKYVSLLVEDFPTGSKALPRYPARTEQPDGIATGRSPIGANLRSR